MPVNMKYLGWYIVMVCRNMEIPVHIKNASQHKIFRSINSNGI